MGAGQMGEFERQRRKIEFVCITKGQAHRDVPYLLKEIGCCSSQVLRESPGRQRHQVES